MGSAFSLPAIKRKNGKLDSVTDQIVRKESIAYDYN